MGFNWAAAFQPRKVGHDEQHDCHRSASIGPRLFSRGKLARNPEVPYYRPLQLGRGFSAAESTENFLHFLILSIASIGPRLFSRGKRTTSTPIGPRNTSLQLGRGFSAAESKKELRIAQQTSQLQLGRGFSAAESGTGLLGRHGVRAASIGPRLFSRGKPGPVTTYSFAEALQLGRGFSAAESRLDGVGGPWHEPLQLGRGFSAAESAIATPLRALKAPLQLGRGFSAAERLLWMPGAERQTSFNWAAAFQPRKAIISMA